MGSLGFHLVKGPMTFSSLIILGTIFALSNIAYCEEQAQLDQPLVDLELCVVWPWKKPTALSRSILNVAVVKCQPHEVCIQQPDTQIYGMEFGRCQPTARPNATKDEIECIWNKPEDCNVDGFPMCIDNKCLGFSWTRIDADGNEFLEIKDNGREVHCKTDNYQTILTDNPVPNWDAVNNYGFWFEIQITNTGKDDVIAFGLCGKNHTRTALPGWEPLSVGYHGDDGGIFVESGKMKFYTNETFTEAKIGVDIHRGSRAIYFTKRSVEEIHSIRNFCWMDQEEYLMNEALYPCVGFRFAKDVIVKFYTYFTPAGLPMSLNNRFKEKVVKNPPEHCPFIDSKMFPV